ncbi:tissue factor-like [Polymixia lowei]
MAFMKTGAYFRVLSILVLTTTTTTEQGSVPKAESVSWLSTNFKTLLTWSPKPRNYTYTVSFAELDADWSVTPDCIRISETECDLTNHLSPLKRTYSADIQTEPSGGMTYDLEEFPHTLSPNFNPYIESQISDVSFRLETAEENNSVSLHITDPLTPVYRSGKLLTIRDVFQEDLKYKIRYHKAGSTGRKEATSVSSIAELSDLEPRQSYCFSVAAYIPSRPKHSQLGAWSQQQCMPAQKSPLEELSVGALAGVLFILLSLIIAIILSTVLCCKYCK